ncbi:molecular chaperone GrpE [Monoraphidium neglectum]|uniref:GrpE protein homolog n=1 Tax=Monoraphidium neglectum TaxID=145388 RepID=A0A0D2LNS0_9CHLO|nr:molecular chaperone GrpE [Monoraphidium neglectum]KIZ07929.1 molecular chaperone GrpE [Monoraphidium neglectum]|eukprot:XP_013906948.1 molecular chaperone GrpE [Monoraphidium neglectum]
MVSPRHPRTLLLRAAGEEEAATAEASTEEAGNGTAAAPAAPPLERARAALEADELDKATLEEALAELEAELSALRESAAAAEAEGARAVALEGSLSAAKDQYLRLQADFDNFRRRTAKEKDELGSRAKGDVVVGLLPLVDNFELARTQVKTETDGEAKIQASYQGLYKQMVEILRGLGVQPVNTVGSPFDPNFHEAIAREANDDVPDGTVLQEFRKGFAMGDRLLRPAMVQVSFTDKPAEVPAAETQEEETPEQPAAQQQEGQQ